MSGPAMLCESTNASGTVQACVEQDELVAYFYVMSNAIRDFAMRACWVRNLVPAPATLDVAAMRDGRPPCQPRAACRHPDGAAPLDATRLRIVWLEEGSAAALLDGDDILALVPAWSGLDGFPGYARDAIGDGALAWELRPGNAQVARVRRADAWWREWDAGSPWQREQPAWLARCEAAFGPPLKYYAIDGGRWPPRALLRFAHDGGHVLVTLGMRLRPQPKAPDEEPFARFQRIELAAFVEGGVPENDLRRLEEYVAAQSDYPWMANTWLGANHTLACDAADGVDAVLLSATSPLRTPALADAFRGDEVSVLWMLPMTAAERAAPFEPGIDRAPSKLRAGIRGFGPARPRPSMWQRLTGRDRQ